MNPSYIALILDNQSYVITTYNLFIALKNAQKIL
jgi:hypothetical protein